MTDTKESTAVAEAPRSELHTYPDGSAVVGSAPFPKKSPLQIAADAAERVGAPAEPEGATANMLTAENVVASNATSRKR